MVDFINSNNDKQLIYDLSKILKFYKDNRMYADMNFANRVSMIFGQNDSISLNTISSSCDNNSGSFTPTDKNLEINFLSNNEWVDIYRKLCVGNKKCNSGNRVKYYNYSFLSTLLHELTHSKQSFLLDNFRSDDLVKIVEYCDKLIALNYEFYFINHDFFPIERYAELRSLLLSADVIDYVYPNENNLIFKFNYLDELLIDYDESGLCPLEYFADLCYLNNLPDFYDILTSIDYQNMSLNEKIFLGFPISRKEYKNINFLVDEMKNKFLDGEYDNKFYSLSYINKRINLQK